MSVHTGDGVRLAEQCKSALSQNPVSNWAVDFWKTFANWLDNIEAGHLEPEQTQFRLYVTPVKRADLSQKLSDAVSDDEIRSVLKDVEKRRAKKKAAPECDPYLQRVLTADTATLSALFRNYRLINTDDCPLAPIEGFLGATLKPDVMTAACKFGIGDAKRRIDDAIRRGESSLINVAEFRKHFQAFIKAHDSERFLHSLSDAPTDEVVQETVARAPRFVRQLDIVDADIETKSRAASDFLRTASDRTRWAEEGIVFEESMDAYDDGLMRRHHNLRDELGITQKGLSDKERGRLLYVRCCDAVPPPLEDRVVPIHFMPGSLNSMADRNLIGWHPNYETVLGEEDE